ncbi:MAG: DnaJ domain-containing protein, partial [Nitrospinaceae bacterium]|nr:J domain-containing protein [Nitrospinaceae bacterium]NIR55894.1 J domain-containing protein [Nitrospinaceae bacterium]NIS86340.1 J domain-containing protein [Nitrospinaceae bacterium]NIT83176.1 J domain-containing protein [Nitrospinaceae bacterium]NIU45385.1 J domain-containing protein [Nitrospinaceae bacterium]
MDQYFKTLNLKWGASLEEAKRAYREQAKIWHPDRFPSHSDALQKKAHDRFQKVSEAFQKIEEFHNSRSRVRWADQQPFT